MAYDNKYGRVTLERGTIAEDELVVVFRAQDPLAPLVMRAYRSLCEVAGCDAEHLERIAHVYHDFRQWQHDHPDRVKDKPGSSGKLP